MGFCLFNTMAVGAEYLKRAHHARRVLIMDWDVHHGNGTQEMFYADSSVFFISMHQYPFYPGTGAAREVGSGAGEGCTLNIPLPAGCADDEYLSVFRDLIEPAVSRFEPEWILVSAGFDPHAHDPLGGMGVTERGFGAIAASLVQLGRRYAGGRTAFLLEGGYNLTALSASVAAVLEQMRKPSTTDAMASASAARIAPLIKAISQLHENYR
jgi:acetoin utilization deacetylase AcuC-like enzyme